MAKTIPHANQEQCIVAAVRRHWRSSNRTAEPGGLSAGTTRQPAYSGRSRPAIINRHGRIRRADAEDELRIDTGAHERAAGWAADQGGVRCWMNCG
jgi:hypothetical protein